MCDTECISTAPPMSYGTIPLAEAVGRPVGEISEHVSSFLDDLVGRGLLEVAGS